MPTYHSESEYLKGQHLLQTAKMRAFGFREFSNPSKYWLSELPPERVVAAPHWEKDFSAFENCLVAKDGARISDYAIHTEPTLNIDLPPRYLGRYDFAHEWNNVGYGRVCTDRSAFALGDFAQVSQEFKPLQVLKDTNLSAVGVVSAILDQEKKAGLWFSRPMANCDGFDWFLVERFFSDYRADDLECTPIIKEIPWGYDSACTMRIDCDEAIRSGRELFELYRKNNIPFGLAIKTQQEIEREDVALIREVIAAGGTAVGHSHTHAPDWGGSRDSALKEVQDSHVMFKLLGVEGLNYRYVVSPFHQNSLEAIKGLQAAGIQMFVSGIIANDPEFLFARAGVVPGVPEMYSHSQQSMLHGDCYHQSGNSWAQYKEAFETARKTETFYGFLDHPFSSYKYGWNTEGERLGVHAEFISYIQKHKVWWASLERALDFLSCKQESQAWVENGELRFRRGKKAHYKDLPDFTIRWKGQDWRAGDFEV